MEPAHCLSASRGLFHICFPAASSSQSVRSEEKRHAISLEGRAVRSCALGELDCQKYWHRLNTLQVAASSVHPYPLRRERECPARIAASDNSAKSARQLFRAELRRRRIIRRLCTRKRDRLSAIVRPDRLADALQQFRLNAIDAGDDGLGQFAAGVANVFIGGDDLGPDPVQDRRGLL